MGRISLVVLLAAVAIAGCGGSRRTGQRRSPVAQAQASHEYLSPSAPRAEETRGSSSPSAAIGAFARAYINWGADSVSADLRNLARRSIGQARAAAQLASAETAGDYELKRDGIANNGTVETVAPLPHHPDQYVVVTREWTTATGTSAYQGLQPAWHVTVATVSPVGRGQWVVSGWQPES
jgi:hypothetical protein